MEARMSKDVFCGELVRLGTANPDELAIAFQRWSQDMDYFIPLDSEPPRMWSLNKYKTWFEKDLEEVPHDSFMFPIYTLADDKLIGFLATFALEWAHGDSLFAIGIGEPEYRGKGYGSDALRVLLRYVFQDLNLRRLGLFVFGFNDRAIRAYEKVGFVREGCIRQMSRRDGHRSDWYMMGILRNEWEARYGN
jgi:RimJ/RimL family protein N-acetyltransferase